MEEPIEYESRVRPTPKDRPAQAGGAAIAVSLFLNLLSLVGGVLLSFYVYAAITYDGDGSKNWAALAVVWLGAFIVPLQLILLMASLGFSAYPAIRSRLAVGSAFAGLVVPVVVAVVAKIIVSFQ